MLSMATLGWASSTMMSLLLLFTIPWARIYVGDRRGGDWERIEQGSRRDSHGGKARCLPEFIHLRYASALVGLWKSSCSVDPRPSPSIEIYLRQFTFHISPGHSRTVKILPLVLTLRAGLSFLFLPHQTELFIHHSSTFPIEDGDRRIRADDRQPTP